MKKLLVLLNLVMVTFFATAQNPHQHPRPDFEKVKAAKIGMITEKLNLTEKQAQKFWPVYNEFDSERGEIFMSIRQKMKATKNEGISENEKVKLLDEIMILREKELKLQKEYKERFLKVITTQQFFDLIETEQEFHRMLIEKSKAKH